MLWNRRTARIATSDSWSVNVGINRSIVRSCTVTFLFAHRLKHVINRWEGKKVGSLKHLLQRENVILMINILSHSFQVSRNGDPFCKKKPCLVISQLSPARRFAWKRQTPPSLIRVSKVTRYHFRRCASSIFRRIHDATRIGAPVRHRTRRWGQWRGNGGPSLTKLESELYTVPLIPKPSQRRKTAERCFLKSLYVVWVLSLPK